MEPFAHIVWGKDGDGRDVIVDVLVLLEVYALVAWHFGGFTGRVVAVSESLGAIDRAIDDYRDQHPEHYRLAVFIHSRDAECRWHRREMCSVTGGRPRFAWAPNGE